MKHLNGFDLLNEYITGNPRIKARCVLASGGNPSDDLHKRLSMPQIEFLQKPFEVSRLREMISSAGQTENVESTSFRLAAQDNG